ncbi:MAG: hypothetical protein BWZ10_00808 [candidate division BRC1 bacterium ADurb.BinA364]|nr:MAG: hypothetical protein BWZ10_00808 [candidate division BRC1 bacterium ADurb.BinA364]
MSDRGNSAGGEPGANRAPGPETFSRRAALKRGNGSALASMAAHGAAENGRAGYAAESARGAMERAHGEMWRRFVDPYGIVLDYVELDGSYDRPTPDECRLAKPNALAWRTPVSNGAMFNGLYLDAMVHRARRTGDEADKAKALRLVEGLLLLASVGGPKGFVGRCVATDGKTTYPLGSNDQTGPWLYGLWRYLRGGLAEGELRRRLEKTQRVVAPASHHR